MKKILVSFVALMMLVACGQSSGTAQSRYEGAYKALSSEKTALKVSVSSMFDNTKVRIQNDNLGHVVLDENVYAAVKIPLEGSYQDVQILAADGSYSVLNGEEEAYKGDAAGYVENIGAALYGEFKNLLEETAPEIEETVNGDVTEANFALQNTEKVFAAIATNELHDIDLDSTNGKGTLTYDKKGALTGGVFYVEFSGTLDNETWTGSTKLEFSVVDAASITLPDAFQ